MMTVGLRPAAFGPGDLGQAQDSPSDPARRQVVALDASVPAAGQAQTMQAARQPDPSDSGDEVSRRRIAEGPAGEGALPADRAAADLVLPRELTAPQPPAETGDALPEAATLRPDPAGPLKSYAQIPMEVVREIARIREEAAEAQAAGVPGRNDPTPMPARPDAIGARIPYDAA